MTYSFQCGAKTDIQFKVGIAGTSSIPAKVMVVLERDGQSVSFSAVKEENDFWAACIVCPDRMFSPGPLVMSINVLLNDKLFVPFKESAEIVDGDNQDVTIEFNQPANIPAQAPEIVPTVRTIESTPVVVPKVTPTIAAKTELPVPKKVAEEIKPVKREPMNLLKSITPAPRKIVQPKKPVVENVTVSAPIFKLKRVKTVYE